MKQEKKKNIIVLTDPDDIVLDAAIAGEIYRVCEENEVRLSRRYQELFKLLQVPDIAASMSARLLEVEQIFKKEVDEFFTDK